MGKIKKLVGSEFLKLKGTWIFWIHLGVPVAGAGLFLLYGVAAKREWQSVLEFYAETLAIVYPSVSAIICMQSVMQELKAGNFQNLLCVSTLRWSAVLRKILTLWILGLAASLLAFLLFGMGVWGTKAAWSLSVKEYLICGLILWITQAGIYLLHFFSGNAFRKWSLSGSRGDAESDCGIALYWIRRWTLDVVSMWMEWTSAVVLCKMENRERSV